MADNFLDLYAASYDSLYREKDYGSEARMLEGIFHRYGEQQVHTVIDFGCGTGSHAYELTKLGYDVTGIDRAEDMLNIARKKDQSSSMRPFFHEGDVRYVDLQKRFDAAISMFAVIGYQVSDDDCMTAFQNARRHLSSGGLFVFDVWFGPAVMSLQPESRQKTVEVAEGLIRRDATTTMDPVKHTCTVTYRLRHIHGDAVVAGSREVHTLRFFFPDELDDLLNETGFKLLRLGQFPDFDRDPGKSTWNVLVIAKAV